MIVESTTEFVLYAHRSKGLVVWQSSFTFFTCTQINKKDNVRKGVDTETGVPSSMVKSMVVLFGQVYFRFLVELVSVNMSRTPLPIVVFVVCNCE